MDNLTPQINGALLRMRREELGWALSDLATRACLSNRQVTQIEEGGTSSFYSEKVKLTAAKKIGGILGLPEQSVFVVDAPEVDLEEVANHEGVSPSPTETHGEVNPDHASPDPKPVSIETTVIQKSTNSALDEEDKPKSKNSFWFIIALFVAALGLAAVMQKPAPTPPPEPPPPLQDLPAEQPDTAASAPVISVAPSVPTTSQTVPTPALTAPAAPVLPTAPTAPTASQAQ
jgi:transcriptional regulator with XRE-family HTH domain